MIEPTDYGDVRGFRLSWWRSRPIGFGVHVYVMRGVLIDTGFRGARDDLASIVASEPLRGAFVTHQHEDHAGNVAWLAARGVPIAIDPHTLRVLQSPSRIGLYRRVTWQSAPAVTTPITPFRDEAMSLVHTPGHSPDHHAVWDRETGTLFAGDLFLGVKVRVAHGDEDPRAMVESLRAMIARAPERVFCAHRGLLPGGTQLLAAKADWLEATIDHVERLARAGAGVAHIRAQVLGARGLHHWISFGEYSPNHWVRAVLRER